VVPFGIIAKNRPYIQRFEYSQVTLLERNRRCFRLRNSSLTQRSSFSIFIQRCCSLQMTRSRAVRRTPVLFEVPCKAATKVRIVVNCTLTSILQHASQKVFLRQRRPPEASTNTGLHFENVQTTITGAEKPGRSLSKRTCSTAACGLRFDVHLGRPSRTQQSPFIFVDGSGALLFSDLCICERVKLWTVRVHWLA
jgi:hypothetical protein